MFGKFDVKSANYENTFMFLVYQEFEFTFNGELY